MAYLNLNADYILQRINHQRLFQNLQTMLKGATFLNLTGAATVSYFVWKTFQFANLYFLKPSKLYKYRAVKSPKGEAPWALITGSSDGIGKALAIELAGKGFNIIVHGRTPSKIAKLAADLEAQYKIKTKTIALDATDPVLSLDEPVLNAIGDTKVTILINCVGGISIAAKRVYDPMVERTESEIDRVFSINGRFMTQLIRILLPRTTEPGIIINVGSTSAYGLPWVQLYSAAKGYLNSLSIALNAEMYATGRDIEVMAVTPGSVAGTPGFKYAVGAFLPDTKTIARSILDRIGSGQTVVSPYWVQGIQDGLFSFPGPQMYKKMVANVMRSMKEIEDKDLAAQK
ncbi:hypothetical protein TWF102_003753 [Orbilia oligospora]|uniref:Very-long-chain 3-oxoacyl-CoA reductase n=1 Tax=Orbilia oligospora TaxID=2813651 RepID=A0A7C8JD82_ORBOL|nr:hypothetical protein TWF102_003753 [Orbilia oligospora]KAF3105263.1 hypothetical protein TWF103_006722 [Orbilia oligospora]KAF3152437.1 hypothetical protein TWF594_004124 [Orbilia oligospora]